MFSLKNDISSEITNFQNDLFFKEHCVRRKFSIFSYIIDHSVSDTPVSGIKSEKIFDNILGKRFFE